MSLESKIDALTAAVVNLTTIMQGAAITPNPAAPVVAAQAPAAPAAPFLAAPPMPPAPTFVAPAPAAPVTPFSDTVGLIKYATEAYTALGAESGPKIQAAFTSLGYQSIEQMKPEHYGEFFARVESLRG